ncbi:hypothetical protein ACA910_013530 [Epithemia clementina (nom. ined.)]
MNAMADTTATTTTTTERATTQGAKGGKTTSKTTRCHGCQQEFASRNAVFKHLKDTDGACLPAHDYDNFCRYVLEKQEEKVLLLFGYCCSTPKIMTSSPSSSSSSSFAGLDQETDNDQDAGNDKAFNSSSSSSPMVTIQNGTDAANFLLDVLISMTHNNSNNNNHVGMNTDGRSLNETGTADPNTLHSSSSAATAPPPHEPAVSQPQPQRPRYLRSYGHLARATPLVAQDDGTGGAVTELLATKLPPIRLTRNQSTHQPCTSISEWLDVVNEELAFRLLQPTESQQQQQTHPPMIRVLGRQPMPSAQFSAESDLTHRRVEYLLPLDFLYVPDHDSNDPGHNETTAHGHHSNPINPRHAWTDLSSYFQSFPCFYDGLASWSLTSSSSSSNHPNRADKTNKDSNDDDDNGGKVLDACGWQKPDVATLDYLFRFKKNMQSLTTQIVTLDQNDQVAVLEKEIHTKKRWRDRKKGGAAPKPASNHNSNSDTNNHNGRSRKQATSQARPMDDKSEDVSATTATRIAEDGDASNTAAIVDTLQDVATCANDAEPHPTKKQRKDDSNIANKNNNVVAKSNKKKKTIHKTKQNDAEEEDDDNNNDNVASKSSKVKAKNVLRRRRYHNFTPSCMAHEYLSYRRLDRIYHRATLRFPTPTTEITSDKTTTTSDSLRMESTRRPLLVLSLNGDLFLHGQVPRLIGLLIALVRGVIPPDFVDCVFDEDYPHLVPTPPAPAQGVYAIDAMYTTWEGKAKAILTARACQRYERGWNDTETLERVDEWQTMLRQQIAQRWGTHSNQDIPNSSDQRLALERQWTSQVLLPWATKARKQLEDYRQWKKERSEALTITENHGGDGKRASSSSSLLHPLLVAADGDPSIVTSPNDTATAGTVVVVDQAVPSAQEVDPSVPLLYQKVLTLLQEADRSGKWPTTTPKRQLVMVSNLKKESNAQASGKKDSQSIMSANIANGRVNDDDITSSDATPPPPWTALATAASVSATASLAMAHIRAKANYREDQSSAYDFVEGEGGASGSFSVGAMPGDKCRLQPKGNELFPELMKAAFELEIALNLPNREPSSTIAINRNAQFRPHTDSGAGAGQSTSLIVGLGTYSGGELVVEGTPMDIRYKPVEFNGWKQRHWTMPFSGERYSLVWFTPKGCEGVRGIDLCT